MFVHEQGGIKLHAADLWLDCRRKRPRGFVSHAHHDHLGRHEVLYGTPATIRLAAHRQGARASVELPYRAPLELGRVRVIAYPAGHVLGSAMIHATDLETGESLLYTGDFRLVPNPTCEPIEVPEADILIMESTYGEPKYRFSGWASSASAVGRKRAGSAAVAAPHAARQRLAHAQEQGMATRRRLAADLVQRVNDTLVRGCVPVLYAYSLGKAQEVVQMLTAAGVPVLLHPAIAEICAIYTAFGKDLGPFGIWPGAEVGPAAARAAAAGHALVWPAGQAYPPLLHGLGPQVRFVLSGWTQSWSRRGASAVEHHLPLSSHADYDELLGMVELVGPKVVFCTHGPPKFAERLRRRGWNACRLGAMRQLTLF